MRHFSIRSLLGLSLLFLVIIPALLVVWWVYQRNASLVDESANRALQQSAAREQAVAQNHLQLAFSTLDGLLPENKSQVQTAQALTWVRDPALFAPMAFALTRASPNLRFVYFTSAAGDVYGVENAAEGFRFGGRGSIDSGARLFSTRPANAPLKLTGAEGESPDPRGRPWYDAALLAKARVFSPVTVYPDSKQLVITLSQPVFDNTGAAAGVLGADLSLQPLVVLLREQRVSPRSVAYLVDDKGFLVASTDDDVMVTEGSGQFLLRTPHSSSNALIRDTFSALEKQWAGAPDLRNAPSERLLRFGLTDQRIFAVHRSVGSNMGLRWKLVIAAPESDFNQDPDASLSVLFAGLAGLILLGILVTSLGGRHLEKVLRQLTRNADQLANGVALSKGLRTPVREFNALSKSLSDCSAQFNENNFDVLSELVSEDSGAFLGDTCSAEAVHQPQPTLVATLLTDAPVQTAPLQQPDSQTFNTLQARLLSTTTELAAARDRSLAATRSKAAFLAVISHELRTPLNGVVGMSALLANTPLNAEQRDYMHSLEVSGQQLQALVDEILEYSRTESGELVLEMAPMNVRSVVEEACDQVARAALAKGIKLTVDVPGRIQRDVDGALIPWVIQADAARLGQVLSQLVSNAVKFTESGSVSVQVRPFGKYPLVGLPMLEARVIDTGQGIAADQLRHVFSAFTQLDSSISRQHGGTGLGLATCKRLVELMGGQIGVESEPGVGSTFWLTILAPWADWPAGPGAASPGRDGIVAGAGAPAGPTSPKMSILVVDDNLINLKVACAMLLKFGYAILTAEGGREAIHKVAACLAKGEKLGAVLMDVHMPDVDGIQATLAIRAAHGSLAPPVIALTAGASGEDRQRCMDAGMVEYLTKPLHISALASVLDRWVESGSVFDPSRAGGMVEKPEQTVKMVCDVPVEVELPKFEPFNDVDLSMPAVMVDFDRLTDFKEFDDAELSMTREVIGLLFSEVPLQLAAIEQAIASNDVPRLIRAAHSLRGAASNVGAVTLQHLCSVLERGTLEAQAVPDDAPACLVAMHSAWSRTRPLLENWR